MGPDLTELVLTSCETLLMAHSRDNPELLNAFNNLADIGLVYGKTSSFALLVGPGRKVSILCKSFTYRDNLVEGLE